MTCRCSPRARERCGARGRRRAARGGGEGEPAVRRGRAGLLAALVVALGVAGCGGRAAGDDGPREAAAAFLERLATGDVAGLCRSLSAGAARELARDFGGTTCRETAAEAARYVAVRPGARNAVRGVTILPTLDVPLSPAPYRAGDGTAALRLVIDDPVLASRQALDVRLRRVAGRWRVDGGVDALFTLARASGRASAR
jgi:hypothetical protein